MSRSATNCYKAWASASKKCDQPTLLIVSLTVSHLLPPSPRIWSQSTIYNLITIYVANCVINGFSSFTAITSNLITIYAIRKTSSLPKPLKTLLLSLAFSDLGVGLLVQPFYTVLIIDQLQGNNRNCTTITAFTIVMSLFSVTSFLGVMLLIVDRFLAIHLHLRYQEVVTHNRVVAAVILMWVFGLFPSLFAFWISQSITSTIFGVISIFCFVTTAFLNYKIYSTVKGYTNQVQPLQTQQGTQTAETTNMTLLKKSAIGTFYIYLVFLFCFLPLIVISVISIFSGSSVATKHLFFYGITLMFLNSSFNPLIYCWKMKSIRHTVINTLRKVLIC